MDSNLFNLKSTPYLLDQEPMQQIADRLRDIEDRVGILRRNGTLTNETIRKYYGDKRFEQVAESNAIEGSTLSVGETELAVMKGITISGHDPAFVRDAIALDRALTKIAELAKKPEETTDIAQVHDVHALLLGDRPGAGIFRNERVVIRGAKHSPPKTWAAIMGAMEQWQNWSKENATLPAPIRAAVLHAWFTHIHPYIDGNGRTARAISNLELIRAGYPPIIIKKKERERYIDSLAESDDGGDIRSFFELIFDRIEGSLLGLENSAKQSQGFNPMLQRIREQQSKQLTIWTRSISLLATIIEHRLSEQLEAVGGRCVVNLFEESLDLDDYVELSAGRNVPRSWAFKIRVEVPGFSRLEKLAWVGPRGPRMHQYLDRNGGPAIYWSRRNSESFPPWIADGADSPFAVEITSRAGNGDEWFARRKDDSIEKVQTTDLAGRIADSLLKMLEGS